MDKRIALKNKLRNRERIFAGWVSYAHPSITETLEAFYTHMGIDCSYKLDPLDSKLYYISEEQIEVEEKPQKYSIYGDFKQGI